MIVHISPFIREIQKFQLFLPLIWRLYPETYMQIQNIVILYKFRIIIIFNIYT